MLVLGRKENESIVIGDNIKITIVGRSGSTIRLGIEAPRDVSVVRQELIVEHAPEEAATLIASLKSEMPATKTALASSHADLIRETLPINSRAAG